MVNKAIAKVIIIKIAINTMIMGIIIRLIIIVIMVIIILIIIRILIIIKKNIIISFRIMLEDDMDSRGVIKATLYF